MSIVTDEQFYAWFESWHDPNVGQFETSIKLSAAKSAWNAALAVSVLAKPAAPIPMVLFCPMCGVQHIDMPDLAPINHEDGSASLWDNPPHRSHLCLACGCIWRPADVPTTGVEKIATQGKSDNFNGVRKIPRVSVPAWQPINTAPRDNKRPLYIAEFSEKGELIALDWDASWEREQESWEIPECYWIWRSAMGSVEEPTHWAYMDGPTGAIGTKEKPE